MHADALDQLTDAVLAADHLGEVADHLIGHFVDQARRSGASWTDIGRSMGVTKQAAQKRFVPKEPARRPRPRARASPGSPPGPATSWSAAQEEARAAGNAEIDPAHLVLGLLAEPEALAAKAIVAAGRRPGRASGRRPTAALPAAGRPRCPRSSRSTRGAKKALELTFREALRLGHNYVGTEHLLLALLELEDGARRARRPRRRQGARRAGHRRRPRRGHRARPEQCAGLPAQDGVDQVRAGLGQRGAELLGQLLGGRRPGGRDAHPGGQRDEVQRRAAQVQQLPGPLSPAGRADVLQLARRGSRRRRCRR